MTAYAIERRQVQARDVAMLPDDVRANPVALFHIMVALAHVAPAAREAWIESRLRGTPHQELADRDRVTRAAVSWRVKAADGAVRAYLEARAT